jgi:hypothetical protein
MRSRSFFSSPRFAAMNVDQQPGLLYGRGSTLTTSLESFTD